MKDIFPNNSLQFYRVCYFTHYSICTSTYTHTHTHTHIRAHTNTSIRTYTLLINTQGDWGSISCRVITKNQKWNLMPSCITLSIIRYGSRVKWSNLVNGVAPSPTP